jgi:hypothetical protein
VTDVLVVAALELRDPMQLFVLVEPYDSPFAALVGLT